MSKKAKINAENMYLSARLEAKLAQAETYPLTVIEAPMGYGKTTGMRFFSEKEGIALCVDLRFRFLAGLFLAAVLPGFFSD